MRRLSDWKLRLRLGLPLLPIAGGAEGTVGLDEPGTIDKRLDTFTVVQTVSALTVHREGIVITGSDAYASIAGVDATFGLDVDVTRLPALVAGTANIGDVDVLTLPALVAGTANIGDVDVLTLPALVAGTANIGDVDVLTIAAGDNNIGNVDIVTMPAVDTELPAVAALADTVANPTTTTVGADLSLFNGTTWDRVRGDITNGLDVDVTRLPALVAGTANIGDVDVLTLPALVAGTANIGDVDVLSVVPGTGATNAGKAIDSVGGATDTGVAPLAVRDDALGALTPIEGDYVALRVDANGALWTHDDALDAAIAGSEVQVDVVAALPAGTNNIGDVDVLTIAAGDNNIGNVDIVTMPNVTLAAGTNTNEVVGDAAHDAAAAGNPVLVGGIAETAADSAPGNRASTDADVVRAARDLDGSAYVLPHGPQIWSYHENSSSALTDASVHAAPGAGLSLYVTDIVCSTGAATAMNIFFEEGASTVLGPYYLEAVAGRGLAIQFRTGKKITANTALTVTTSAAIAHGIDVTGYTAPG